VTRKTRRSRLPQRYEIPSLCCSHLQSQLVREFIKLDIDVVAGGGDTCTLTLPVPLWHFAAVLPVFKAARTGLHWRSPAAITCS